MTCIDQYSLSTPPFQPRLHKPRTKNHSGPVDVDTKQTFTTHPGRKAGPSQAKLYRLGGSYKGAWLDV